MRASSIALSSAISAVAEPSMPTTIEVYMRLPGLRTC